MDGETSTRHCVDLLERVLLDGNAEPTYVPLSLLEDITNCFSDDHRIGSGGFAVVYKGIVGKEVVAVKKLSKTSNLPETKFHREIECLMKAKHKNIVRFVGYCSEVQGRIADYEGNFVMSDIRNWLLCFEYVPNGSLDKYITDASSGLEWRKRYDIIKGICEGLLHLHKKRILHLDLKPGNILVDEHMVPKITDFGLSMCLGEDQSQAFTSNLCGSLGYLPPEFFRGQQGSKGQRGFASDIYSLGVIIMEILTGDKWYPEDEIVEQVVKNWMNRLEGSDQRDMQLEQVRVCSKIGMECMDSDPKKRPDASHIIDRLEKMSSPDEPDISSSSVEQLVSFLHDQYCQGKIANRSPEYLRKDIKESAETEELGECAGPPREDHWQQGKEEAPVDQLSLWETEGASISGSKSGMLYRLKNLFRPKIKVMTTSSPALDTRRFSYRELLIATKNFSDKERLGEGGFGLVYHGYLKKTDTHVAVKRVSRGSQQEIVEYVAEVSVISQLRHRNLVQLVGWCHHNRELLLVYELIPNGSLDRHIHNQEKVLLWSLRHEIVLGVGSALLYLHEEWEQCVLHRDIKPSNLMLDRSFRVKLGDFGLAKLVEHDEGSLTTILAGTKGYMDPECIVTGKASKESDVYSFGVVVLEIMTGRRPLLMPRGNEAVPMHLVQFVWELYNEGKILDAADVRLKGEFDNQEMERLMVAALWCAHPDSRQRPSIRKAVNVMRSEVPLPILQDAMLVFPVDGLSPSPTRTSRSSSYRTGTVGSS